LARIPVGTLGFYLNLNTKVQPSIVAIGCIKDRVWLVRIIVDETSITPTILTFLTTLSVVGITTFAPFAIRFAT
jgi:hypothetical protein